MATHSSLLAWRMPWTEGPGGLQSMRSQRVEYDWAHMHSVTCMRYCMREAGVTISGDKGSNLVGRKIACEIFPSLHSYILTQSTLQQSVRKSYSVWTFLRKGFTEERGLELKRWQYPLPG